MIKILSYNTMDKSLLNRRPKLSSDKSVDAAVSEIIRAVDERGDQALRQYTEKFDGAHITDFRVSDEELDRAFTETDESLLEVMEKAAVNIRAFHSKQVRQGYAMRENPGVILGQRITAIERAGIYVPGGTASYPSTVLMDAIPAKLAGVGRLIMCTPPDSQGRIAPSILSAAKIAGVDEIYKLGGAQAIAAMALGTESIPAVYKIAGPGNIYVATAKRMVFGLVDIDMIAGPSDILIIADDTANSVSAAADMLAQAEHDKLASAVLVTDSPVLAESVADEIEHQIKTLPRQEIARAAIYNNSMIIVVRNLDEAVAVSNEIAPEHLEILTSDPFAQLSMVQNAGSIFLGENAPEALGDYLSGTNHTIPTMGTARFASPLSVDDFIKKSSFTYYSPEALQPMIADIGIFARWEGLEGHARSAECRISNSEAGCGDE